MAQTRGMTTGRHAAVVGRTEGTFQQFMTYVFAVMMLGLATTGLAAELISNSPGMMASLFRTYTHMVDGKLKSDFAASGWWYFAAGSELLLVIVMSWRGLNSSITLGRGLLLFGVFSGLNGITLAPVLYAYTGTSVVRVFFITSAMFGGCALWGLTTKYDLRGLGSFFLAGLIGILVALIVSAFYQAPAMDYAISVLGVLLFAGLIAFDVQKLEQAYDENEGTYTPGLVVWGALALYLDFLNMFLFLLRLFGIKTKSD
ncbi:MAG TPA: Bax inhibitor-1/YccA family protein [Candidatus Paceibacterota bacterium]|nr:Bax inhibitor-1/YccA family protein [Candidatus Paceibacterota bacterium]